MGPLSMDDERAIVSLFQGQTPAEGGMGSRYSRARGTFPPFFPLDSEYRLSDYAFFRPSCS